MTKCTSPCGWWVYRQVSRYGDDKMYKSLWWVCTGKSVGVVTTNVQIPVVGVYRQSQWVW